MTGRDIVLIATIICSLSVFTFGYFYAVQPAQQLNESVFESAAVISDTLNQPDSDFLLAQRYFNHAATGVYDLTRAREAYFKVLAAGDAANPAEYYMSWYQLGRIDFLEGKFDAAIYKFDHVIQNLGDAMPSAYYLRGLSYGYRAKYEGITEDWQLAAHDFEYFLTLKPESPWARTDLSWIYFSEARYVDMLSVLRKGLESEPENPWLLNMYGLALLNTGDRQAAAEEFAKAAFAADQVTPAEWGASYPGNDSRLWADNLDYFREVIRQNLQLANS